MDFEILGDLTGVETIAKGYAEIRLANGETVRAELHWYEATGIGRREFKIKRIL